MNMLTCFTVAVLIKNRGFVDGPNLCRCHVNVTVKGYFPDPDENMTPAYLVNDVFGKGRIFR
jgi:hypothetical protein